MALLHNKYVTIKGVSACVPKNVVKNMGNAHFALNDINAFISNVGVEELRMSGKEICTSDLCVSAAEKLLEELHTDKNDIGILVFVSQFLDYYFLLLMFLSLLYQFYHHFSYNENDTIGFINESLELLEKIINHNLFHVLYCN